MLFENFPKYKLSNISVMALIIVSFSAFSNAYAQSYWDADTFEGTRLERIDVFSSPLNVEPLAKLEVCDFVQPIKVLETDKATMKVKVASIHGDVWVAKYRLAPSNKGSRSHVPSSKVLSSEGIAAGLTSARGSARGSVRGIGRKASIFRCAK